MVWSSKLEKGYLWNMKHVAVVKILKINGFSLVTRARTRFGILNELFLVDNHTEQVNI